MEDKQMVKYIKVINDDRTEVQLAPLALCTLTFGYDEDLEKERSLNCIYMNDGVDYDTLVSTTGDLVEIEKLNVSSYEEFLIALDMHNCLFIVDEDGLLTQFKPSKKSDIDSMFKLRKENANLKRQLGEIKSMLKKINV